ncbi:alanine--tRNA ligase, mitochondrial isoform X1 [Nerophis ophidion]|uniref:alanine--tRNA ligase, mitochondrial isoform X1 n=1 Tax=Nerophis ophidion TaxID=159077 RepID=UPI002ADF5F38|nr:alanine--tRNA ligase, mitochondrial isoform X1 [Nerophis ophidion]
MLGPLHRSLGATRRLSGPPVRFRVRSTRARSACPPEVGAARVRKTFLDFFQHQHQHRLVLSSPVRPRGDPSLLFVNAGMNQFKPLLLGTVDPRSDMASYRRVVNSQKCVRAGGKHNDLEDVGKDVYHHTFFEMLGNWSFGDYFKEEACAMAWSLLTQHYGIPADRLYVSYFAGDPRSGLAADEETRQIWLELGRTSGRWGTRAPVVPARRSTTTTWAGETPPCWSTHTVRTWWRSGTWSSCSTTGRRSSSCGPCPVRAWTRGWDWRDWSASFKAKSPTTRRTSSSRCWTPSSREAAWRRTAAGRSWTWPTGWWLTTCARWRSASPTGSILACRGRSESCTNPPDQPIPVSGDFLLPVRLVLRKILRRAVRFCVEVLRAPPGTLASLVPTVAHTLGQVYPELHREADRVMDVINQNEDHFLSSLQQGSNLIGRTLRMMQDTHQLFPAAVAWSLHRDLGFPLDLVDLMLEERGVLVDRQQLDLLMAQNHKAAAEHGDAPPRLEMGVVTLAELQRLGVAHTDQRLKYHYRLEQKRYVFPACRAAVVALFDGQRLVSHVEEGQRCGVILDRTSFYAEQGGQAADRGYLVRDDLQEVPFSVEAVFRAGGYVIHQVTAAHALRTGDGVHLHLDQAHRLACMVNHTATHLLNLALRKVLGPSVQQRGSHLSAGRLRLDFSFKGSLSRGQLQQVEDCVNQVVLANQPVYVQEVALQSAMSIAGLRTVDEVYPDPVRVVSVSVPVSELLEDPADRRTSVELCCGTHLLRTAAIHDLVIVSEKQLVRGISRVVAVTGRDATQAREAGQSLLQEVDSLSARMTSSASSCLDSAQSLAKEVGVLSDAVDNTPIPHWQRAELQARLKTLQRSSNTAVRKIQNRQAAVQAQSVLDKNEHKDLLVDSVEAESLSVVMKTVNQLSWARPQSHVMLLAHQRHSGKVLCACQVPKDSAALSASAWAEAVCRQLGGEGRGSAVVARGTGSSDDIAQAVRWAEQFARRILDGRRPQEQEVTSAS